MSFVADQDLLMEDEADKQRIVEENYLARYVAVIKQERAAADRVREEQELVERAKRREEYRKTLARDLKTKLGLDVPLERVRIEETGDFGEWYPAVEFGGVTFALRHANSQYHVSYKVHIAQPCIRCSAPVWESVGYPSDLAYELERNDHAHDFNCVETRDDDDDDDEGGWPAAAAAPKAPTRTERYTAAIKRRRELQFERAKEKEFATRRILANKGVTFNGETFVVGSATAAEKLVEFDEGYAAACAALTEAVIAEIGAREALRAAGGSPSKEDEEA